MNWEIDDVGNIRARESVCVCVCVWTQYIQAVLSKRTLRIIKS